MKVNRDRLERIHRTAKLAQGLTAPDQIYLGQILDHFGDMLCPGYHPPAGQESQYDRTQRMHRERQSSEHPNALPQADHPADIEPAIVPDSVTEMVGEKVAEGMQESMNDEVIDSVKDEPASDE